VAEPTIETLLKIEALQMRYAKALDRRDMKAWAECFGATEAHYECNSRENVDAGFRLAMMLADNPRRIQDQVKAVDEVWAGTFQDYFTRHIFQRLECRELTAGRFAVESNFIVTFTNGQDGDTRLLVTGEYQDEVLFEEGLARFASRKAIFDCNVVPRYLVYPI
jgi:3-phenylpropionate/cinnamic acid dioxygenase small subunit